MNPQVENITLIPGHALIAMEDMYGAGEVGGIHLPQVTQGTPVNTGIVVKIEPTAEDEAALGIPAAELLGERVLLENIGGRPFALEGFDQYFVYPLRLRYGNRKKPQYKTTIQAILAKDAAVDATDESDNPRCRRCGDAKPGERGGRSMMMTKREVNGLKRWWCPRCHHDERGTRIAPPSLF